MLYMIIINNNKTTITATTTKRKINTRIKLCKTQYMILQCIILFVNVKSIFS